MTITGSTASAESSEPGHMERIDTRHRWMGIVLFLIYLACLSYFLFFAEALGRGDSEEYHYNLVLFREIRRFWNYRDLLGWRAFFLNTFGNVLAFLPFGFFLPVVIRRRIGLPVSLLTGFLFSLTIEMTQLATMIGSFDVDDIFLNTIGAGLGYVLFSFCYGILPPADET